MVLMVENEKQNVQLVRLVEEACRPCKQDLGSHLNYNKTWGRISIINYLVLV